MTAARFSYAALGALFTLAPTGFAQSTAGVFGPVVREGDLSAQYRIGFDPDTDAWAQRVHVQSAFNTSLRGRVVVQFDRDPGQDADIDFVQGELLWQLTPDGEAYQTALRFDVQIRDSNQPDLVRATWTNQYALNEKWQLRGLLVTAGQSGDGAFDGIALETRSRVNYSLDAGPHVGLEIFSQYGTTENVRDLDDQVHLIGPYASAPAGENWSIFSGLLFGATDRSPDVNLRLWIGRSF
ncbi:MAG: hypothetical protein AAF253_10720 [Pseudomonadota bacterium]